MKRHLYKTKKDTHRYNDENNRQIGQKTLRYTSESSQQNCFTISKRAELQLETTDKNTGNFNMALANDRLPLTPTIIDYPQ